MNKLNREIVKSLKQIKANVNDKYQKFFNKLKKNNIIAFGGVAAKRWNDPYESDFRSFGANAKKYIKNLQDNFMITKPNDYVLLDLIDQPDYLTCVTKEELKKFETVTYPMLYSAWCAKRKLLKKNKSDKNAKDPEKICAKIDKLQRQLDELK